MKKLIHFTLRGCASSVIAFLTIEDNEENTIKILASYDELEDIEIGEFKNLIDYGYNEVPLVEGVVDEIGFCNAVLRPQDKLIEDFIQADLINYLKYFDPRNNKFSINTIFD